MKPKRFLAIAVVFCVIACGSLSIDHFGVDDKKLFEDDFSLINRCAKVLCSFRASLIYVYFENHTSIGYPGYIMWNLNMCGTSYVTLRNKYKTMPLEVIPDDGILMYMVLVMKDATQYIDLSIVKKKSASKHRSYFLVIVEDAKDIDDSWLRSTFHEFWEIWVLNVVIMFNRNSEFQIYSYSPFSTTFLKKLDPNVTGRDGIFPPEMPNMNRRPLRICLYPDEVRAVFHPNGDIFGADGFMASFLASRLNATEVVRIPSNHATRNFGESNANDTGDFCLSQMIKEESDMALNARFLAPDIFEKFVEHSFAHSRDDLCVMVPKARAASLFWNLFRAFQVPVWMVIVMMFLFASMVFKVLLPQADHLFIKLYSTMLTQPLKETPPKISVRLFLLCWFTYCLLISGAYKCNLTSNLVFRISLPDIDTLLELAESHYEILTYARHQPFLDKFLNSSVPYLNKIKKKAIPVADDFLVKKLDENNQNYAYLEKYHTAYFRVNSRRNNHYGHPLFHLMQMCPIPFHAVYIVPYGSPYLGILNTLVRWAHEHGFAGHWTKYMDTQFKHSGKSVVRNSQNEDGPVVLRFAHLQAAFYLLGFGLTLATLVLLCEIGRVYGIGMFVYNRKRWKAKHLEEIRNTLLGK